MALASYQDLVGWQKSIDLVSEIYRQTQAFPRQELYGLSSQLRRAAFSIPSNIAEGQGRMTRGEFRQFLGHARGSAFEVETQIVIARNLGYLSELDARTLIAKIREIGRILTGLLHSLDRNRTAE